jgi:hypothetical protein
MHLLYLLLKVIDDRADEHRKLGLGHKKEFFSKVSLTSVQGKSKDEEAPCIDQHP